MKEKQTSHINGEQHGTILRYNKTRSSKRYNISKNESKKCTHKGIFSQQERVYHTVKSIGPK